MTKTIGIDCHKWLEVTAIGLWSLATIGLGFGIYVGYDHMINGVPPLTKEQCDQLPDHGEGWCDPIKDSAGFFIALVANIGNVIGMWIAVNKKYQFYELKCTSSNDEITERSGSQ